MTLPENRKVIFCIAAVRSGSNRLVNKNIIDFSGKSLIAWTIETALKSPFIYDTIDCELKADIAKYYGAGVPELRPLHVVTVSNTPFDVIKYHRKKLENLLDYVLMLRPTSLIRRTEDIDAVKALLQNYDTVFFVKKSSKPSAWSPELNTDLELAPFFSANSIKIQPQQKSHEYFINGVVFGTSKNWFLKEKTFFRYLKPVGYEMPADRTVDICTKLDLASASALHFNLDVSKEIL